MSGKRPPEPATPGTALLRHIVDDGERTRRMAVLLIVGAFALTMSVGALALMIWFAGMPVTVAMGAAALVAGSVRHLRSGGKTKRSAEQHDEANPA
ncbi:hypothetical protein [Amycolatopsis sp. BJA-103]|uniref:hypothetical protein n=1 Tax=Amycolatopsis sp. BJA-103 TaxID=1911175 RepID=UPI000C78DD93|nr:hypothetical protein [Amycolatopsis sp. BJA-103]AUI59035.1 hypothetical protein BKN51_13005 [Amycolatopsis sp. BJA-103]PNE17516.1 hypothetical protein B1H26_21525 [Amycolatopsis sp. BJA-103]